MTSARKGRKMLMNSTIMEFILKIMALAEMFLMRPQNTARKGPEIDTKTYVLKFTEVL